MPRPKQFESASGFRFRAATAVAAFWFALVAGLAPRSAQAQNFQVLHYFSGGTDGALPVASLTYGGQGTFYGTTYGGGDYGYGNVFQLSQSGSSWTLEPLHVFTGDYWNSGRGDGGIDPFAPVVIGADGNLYGTAGVGGDPPYYGGTVFKMFFSENQWFYNVIYAPRYEQDGWGFNSPVTFDSAGNIYGTNVQGGTDVYCGTAFELSNQGWQPSILWNFGEGHDGCQPWAGLILDRLGNLYGTTVSGGQYGYGTIFELYRSGSGWQETILYNFQGRLDGGSPYRGVIMDAAGNLYGGAGTGGAFRSGTIFELTPSGSGWNFQVLYALPPRSGGPFANVVMDNAGNLYGTTTGGGKYEQGAVFKLTHSANGWTYSDLHDFDEIHGADPEGGVVFDESGNLYGTTTLGGLDQCEYGCGVIFELTP